MFSIKILLCVFLTLVFANSYYRGQGVEDVQFYKTNEIYNNEDQQCCDYNRINVNGEGNVNAQPNIAILSLGVSEAAQTSQSAVNAASAKINQIIAILKKKGVQDQDISTTSLNVFPQFQFDANGGATIVGQIASQTLNAKIRNIGKAGANVGPIIDSLSIINGIIVNNIQFDLEDKSQAQNDARALAFKDAKKKAVDYAYFSSAKVGRVLKIQENSFSSVNPVPQGSFDKVQAAPTQIIANSLTIAASVLVTFQLSN